MLNRILAITVLSLVTATGCAQTPPTSAADLYKVAREQAAAGHDDAAIATLQKAVDAGFYGYRTLRSDQVFDRLRNAEQYKALELNLRKRVFPCEYSPRHREFDFWAGNWDVFMGNGAKAGSNTITVVENGCVLEELWRSSTGGSGRSINYYDADKDKWVQNWVSADGLIINIEGGIEEGSMVMVGRSFYTSSGKSADFRGKWTLLEDGRVRQFFEESYDEGETWSPWFEGFYVRTESGD